MPTDTTRSARPRALALVAAAGLAGCGGSPPEGQAPTSLAASPEAKAAMDYASARGHEAARKPAAALEAYRRIVKDYPETTQARLAADRIRALAGR